MVRSNWKCNFFKVKMSKFFEKNVVSRNMLIHPLYVGLIFNINVGNHNQDVDIKQDMVGKNLGMFTISKKIGNIHNLNKKSSGFRKKKK